MGSDINQRPQIKGFVKKNLSLGQRPGEIGGRHFVSGFIIAKSIIVGRMISGYIESDHPENRFPGGRKKACSSITGKNSG
jgi:hypothetical protein